MLVALAATGVLRGLQDTRTPLVASAVGFTANIALNLLFVYGFGWGIAGSAWGTVLAQTGMALGLVTVLVRHALRAGAGLHAHPGRVLKAAVTGVPLLVRTLALRSNNSAPAHPRASTTAARTTDRTDNAGPSRSRPNAAMKKPALWMTIPITDSPDREAGGAADFGVLSRFANTAAPNSRPLATAAPYCSGLVEMS